MSAIDTLRPGIIDGDRRSLARAITLAESTRPDHRRSAEDLIQSLLDRTGRSRRVGITGTPGVGKSTFIDALGTHLVAQGSKVAVLAVDPSSSTGGGSILGDKTRMGALANSDEVFIRPSPSGGITGGVASRTRDAVLLCEAAGFDTVLVETVGVGQSETTVADITDIFLLLIAPGGGDDLQGIKRGVMELADLITVNKADGATSELAARTADEYRTALHLVRPKRPGQEVAVVTCSALESKGVAEVWDLVDKLHRGLADSGELDRLRQHQALSQLDREVRSFLYLQAESNPEFARRRSELRQSLTAGEISVSRAARMLAEST